MLYIIIILKNIKPCLIILYKILIHKMYIIKNIEYHNIKSEGNDGDFWFEFHIKFLYEILYFNPDYANIFDLHYKF